MSEFLKMTLAIGVPLLLTMLLLYVTLKPAQRPPQPARAKVAEGATAALVAEADDAREVKRGGE